MATTANTVTLTIVEAHDCHHCGLCLWLMTVTTTSVTYVAAMLTVTDVASKLTVINVAAMVTAAALPCFDTVRMCDDRLPHLRRLELRGPASDEALLSVLSTVNSALRHESAKGDADGDVSRADGNDSDRILKHLKDTGEFIS